MHAAAKILIEIMPRRASFPKKCQVPKPCIKRAPDPVNPLTLLPHHDKYN
jgi:hypothetical protein